MTPWFLYGFIITGTLFVSLCIVLIACYCHKKRLCCCQDRSDDGKALLDSFRVGDMSDEDFKPYINGSRSNEGFQPDSLTCVLSDTDNQTYYLSREDVLADTAKRSQYDDFHTPDVSAEVSADEEFIQPPKTYISVRTYAESVTTDSQFGGGADILGEYNKMSQDSFIEGVQLKITLLYSKADLFLMLTVNELKGMPDKENGGHDFIRLSIALLPEKKYRSKTKVQHVSEETVIFGESFKFSNVTRESLFSSAFRFRLYAKQKIRREVCVGELVVQLADVAQRAGGFITWKSFEQKRK